MKKVLSHQKTQAKNILSYTRKERKKQRFLWIICIRNVAMFGSVCIFNSILGKVSIINNWDLLIKHTYLAVNQSLRPKKPKGLFFVRGLRSIF